MHEIALCRSVIETVREQAAIHSFDKVLVVRLEIGVLSHVEAEAMIFAFDVVARGTVAEGARLEVSQPPGRALCGACAAEVTLSRRFDPCPCCGGRDLTVIDGDKMRVRDLEVT